MTDHRRAAANSAVRDHLLSRDTNSITDREVWTAVNLALDAYEDQQMADLNRHLEPSWALMYEGRPVLIVPTKRGARAQRKILAALGGVRRSAYRICPTQVALDTERHVRYSFSAR